MFLVDFEGRQRINGTIIYKVELDFAEAEVKVHLKQKPKKLSHFTDIKIDMCKFLNGEYKNNRFLGSVLKALENSRSILQKCPWPANVLYIGLVVVVYVLSAPVTLFFEIPYRNISSLLTKRGLEKTS
ncbi:uncharacterized protein LOC128855820 isoform X2 [Anastrepha ludens]|nr:uncharacterized protein LOC128855820 isoform X2 [Anastrepha ludens]